MEEDGGGEGNEGWKSTKRVNINEEKIKNVQFVVINTIGIQSKEINKKRKKTKKVSARRLKRNTGK